MKGSLVQQAFLERRWVWVKCGGGLSPEQRENKHY